MFKIHHQWTLFMFIWTGCHPSKYSKLSTFKRSVILFRSELMFAEFWVPHWTPRDPSWILGANDKITGLHWVARGGGGGVNTFFNRHCRHYLWGVFEVIWVPWWAPRYPYIQNVMPRLVDLVTSLAAKRSHLRWDGRSDLNWGLDRGRLLCASVGAHHCLREVGAHQAHHCPQALPAPSGTPSAPPPLSPKNWTTIAMMIVKTVAVMIVMMMVPCIAKNHCPSCLRSTLKRWLCYVFIWTYCE